MQLPRWDFCILLCLGFGLYWPTLRHLVAQWYSDENFTYGFFVPLFSPGEVQSVYFLDREPDNVWRYYSVARTDKKANSLTAGHEASSINRAVAYYRHLAGIPTGQEPPAAR